MGTIPSLFRRRDRHGPDRRRPSTCSPPAVDGTDYAFAKASPDDTAVAYRVMPGVGYPLGDAAEARPGYRYFGTSDAKFEGIEAGLSSHNIETGLLLQF